VFIISPWGGQEASQEDSANATAPLTSLTATIASSQWGQTFWARQAEAQSPLWAEAKTYCTEDAHKDLPNCGFVNLAAFLNQPRKPVPEYGTSPSAVSSLPEIKAPQ
jgi:hypothetical protein